MLEAELHRGPDADGVYADDHVVLGHRRLSIIDLSAAGKQPMTNEDGSVWAIFNGEIYNFQELTAELRSAGHAFRSHTDTEVLIHGYEQWGIGGLLDRLLGMFAFALYHVQPDGGWRLFLGRDRLGIKPLYYWVSLGCVVFASEVRAVLKSGIVPTDIEPTALVGFLAQGSVPSPWTCVRNVRCLEPGHYAMVSKDRWSVTRYWNLSYGRRDTGDPAHLLADSIRRHLIADVPIGIFLSGGMDSASLAAIAKQYHSGPISTLTIAFDEVEFNEGAIARRFADRLQTEHHEIRITARTFLDHLPRFFASLDQPTSDGVNTYLVSLAARQLGLKVVLSGLGGDEVYFGYHHYRFLGRHARPVERYAALPGLLRTSLARLLVLYGAVRGQERWRRFGYSEWCSPEVAAYLLFRGFFPEQEIAELLGMEQKSVRQRLLSAIPLPQTDWPSAPAHQFNLMEINRYLHDQLLRDSDVFSMAHSIELRVPFLDHRLVESLAALPPQQKIDATVNKPRLLDGMNDELLHIVARSPKSGFTFPLPRWLRQESGDLEELSLKGRHFEPQAVRRLWTKFRNGRLHWSRVWALAVIEAGGACNPQ